MTLPPSQNSSGPPALMVGMAGAGKTVTSTVVAQFEHSSAVAVKKYLTTPFVVPVLFRTCWIVLPHPEEQSLKPDIVPPVGGVSIAAVQVNTVPIMLLDIAMFVLVFGQTDCDAGLTVTAII